MAGKSKSKKAPPMLLNLDAEDGEEEYILPDEEDGGGLTKKEAIFRDTLTKKYSNCRRCGTGVPCKINWYGLHSHLTFNQMNAWAIALVCGQLYPMKCFIHHSPSRLLSHLR
jgi:hypothetical protein